MLLIIGVGKGISIIRIFGVMRMVLISIIILHLLIIYLIYNHTNIMIQQKQLWITNAIERGEQKWWKEGFFLSILLHILLHIFLLILLHVILPIIHPTLLPILYPDYSTTSYLSFNSFDFLPTNHVVVLIQTKGYQKENRLII